VNDPSLALIPEDHPFMNQKAFEQKGRDLLEKFYHFFSSPKRFSFALSLHEPNILTELFALFN